MKKIITLLLVLIAAFSLGSCKKSKKNQIATTEELKTYLDAISLNDNYNIKITCKAISRNANSEQGSSLKSVVKGHASVSDDKITQFYLNLEKIATIRKPKMYGKEVEKTTYRTKIYATEYNNVDTNDNEIYIYDYEKETQGKSWTKSETKTKEKTVDSDYTDYFNYYSKFFNVLNDFYKSAKKSNSDEALDINYGLCIIKKEKCTLTISYEAYQETYVFIKDGNELTRIEYKKEAKEAKTEIVVKLVSKASKIKLPKDVEEYKY